MNENQPMAITQVDSHIQIRPFDFDFPADLDPNWVPDNPYRSHFYNGVSLTMPYLEPFLCKTMREATEAVSDSQLREDMQGFIGQEAQHYRCHRRLNALLTDNGQPGFAGVEAIIAESYKQLSTRSLRRRLAYAAGFETMTNGFTALIAGQRQKLFRNADPHITSFWLAHMVEEAEHKTVAFDVYQHCYGEYWPRALGVLQGSFGVLGLGMRGMLCALKQDGRLFSLKDAVGLTRELALIGRAVLPFLFRAMAPSYDPRNETEDEWVTQWIATYAAAPPFDVMPLVDTQDPEMKSPFVAAAA